MSRKNLGPPAQTPVRQVEIRVGGARFNALMTEDDEEQLYRGLYKHSSVEPKNESATRIMNRVAADFAEIEERQLSAEEDEIKVGLDDGGEDEEDED